MEKIRKFFILTKKKKFDKTTFFVTFLMFSLVIFGCIMVYSASYYSAGNRYGNEYFFLLKQLMGVVLGVFAFIFFAFFILFTFLISLFISLFCVFFILLAFISMIFSSFCGFVLKYICASFKFLSSQIKSFVFSSPSLSLSLSYNANRFKHFYYFCFFHFLPLPPLCFLLPTCLLYHIFSLLQVYFFIFLNDWDTPKSSKT